MDSIDLRKLGIIEEDEEIILYKGSKIYYCNDESFEKTFQYIFSLPGDTYKNIGKHILIMGPNFFVVRNLLPLNDVTQILSSYITQKHHERNKLKETT